MALFCFQELNLYCIIFGTNKDADLAKLWLAAGSVWKGAGAKQPIKKRAGTVALAVRAAYGAKDLQRKS